MDGTVRTAGASEPGNKAAPEPLVVLVDDDPAVLEEVRDYLELLGQTVWATNSATRALAHLDLGIGPFVLLTDVRMPDMSGLELVRRVSQTASSVPFETVLLSGVKDIDAAIDALKLGALDFLVKPFNLGQLDAVIRRASERLRERASLRGVPPSYGQELVEALANAHSVARSLNGVIARQQTWSSATGGGDPAPGLSGHDWLLRCIKLDQTMRRQRDKLFPSCSLDDASWEILIYVCEQSLLGRAVSLTSACHASSIPQSTATRKIDGLAEDGLIVREPDPDDRRRTLVYPSDKAMTQCMAYYEAFREQLAFLLS